MMCDDDSCSGGSDRESLLHSDTAIFKFLEGESESFFVNVHTYGISVLFSMNLAVFGIGLYKTLTNLTR